MLATVEETGFEAKYRFKLKSFDFSLG